jgi:hypothetical protein
VQLDGVAPRALEESELVLIAGAVGDDAKIEIVTEVDDRFQQRFMGALAGQIAIEIRRQLQAVEEIAGEMMEAGLLASEVVESEADAGALEGRQAMTAARQIGC